MTKAEAQERGFVDDVSAVACGVGVFIIGLIFFWATGLFSWDYNDTNPTQGAVLEKNINPEGMFEQQKCAFLWFGCYQLQSNYRLGLIDGDNLGYVVVTPEEFDKYEVGTYYP